MHKAAALFTPEDVRQIEAEGLTVPQVEFQVESMVQGAGHIRLGRPCTIGDGIARISPGEREELVRIFEQEATGIDIVKFVPASGAASRMFSDWFQALENSGFPTAGENERFYGSLEKYAFFGDLEKAAGKSGEDLRDLVGRRRTGDILRYILTPAGLNYGNLPKALLKFHRYPEAAGSQAPEAFSRTAIEEHLVEAAHYARGKSNVSRLHITVSAEHEEAVRDYLEKVLAGYERRYDVKYDIEISIQASSSNTLALDDENNPLRDAKGNLVFRPGGHGALLANLNGIRGDIVIIKNIDNISPEKAGNATGLYKKTLGGYLLRLQREMFGYMRLLKDGSSGKDMLKDMAAFCKNMLNVHMAKDFDKLPADRQKKMLYEWMNRPLRVCGVVKNEGEPGGGPFWVEDKDGMLSLQIVEEFQVDRSSASQKAIWQSATHFNPVDLVCGIADYRGRKFDLNNYVNREAFCVSRKTEKGRVIKALELPGLWNGSMAYWNTVFVEVPLETFNPVKTVYDLLRPQHLPS